MIEVQKGQIQECQATEESGLEWKSPDSQYSPFLFFFYNSMQFCSFVIVVLQMSAIKQN